MAGGFNTPELAAGVANAGGVGSFGFAYSQPSEIDQTLAATKKLTTGLINANFFIFPTVAAPIRGELTAALDALKTLPIEADVIAGALPLKAPYVPDLTSQLEPVWRHRPAMLTFHFGVPNPWIISRAHELGISVGVTVTCLSEAQKVVALGVDFIVAQGWEAGGHRGIFESTVQDEKMSVLDLVGALVANVALPVIAAGGMMTGAHIASAIEVGANAAQLGTAFLCCNEAATPAAHRGLLQSATVRQTQFTDAFSGRAARGIRNRYMEHMQDKPVLAFPLQNTLTSSLRAWASENVRPEFQSVWAGTGYRYIRSGSVGALMTVLIQEVQDAQK